MRLDAFAALRHAPVRRFILGRLAWLLGGQMLGVAVGWQVYDRTRSMVALGLVGLAQVLPVLLFALPAGRFVDRTNRRDAGLLAMCVYFIAAAALFGLSAADAPTWSFYPALAVLGLARTLGAPASSALFAQLTPRALFVNANTWKASTFELASTAGPAFAGGLIAWTGGATTVYALNLGGVLSFAAVLLTIARPPTPPAPEVATTPTEEMRAGLRFVFRTKLLLSAITLDMFAVLFGGATALLPAFAEEILHVGPEGLGWLRAAPSIGALTMALVQTRIRPWQRSGLALLWSVVGFGVSTIVFGLSTSFTLSFVMLLLAGAFDNISVIIRLSLEQLITPEALRGRVASVHYVFIGMSNEMGELESGLTAAAFGAVGSVVGGGVATLLVVAFVAWRWPVLRNLGPMASVQPAPVDEPPRVQPT